MEAETAARPLFYRAAPWLGAMLALPYFVHGDFSLASAPTLALASSLAMTALLGGGLWLQLWLSTRRHPAAYPALAETQLCGCMVLGLLSTGYSDIFFATLGSLAALVAVGIWRLLAYRQSLLRLLVYLLWALPLLVFGLLLIAFGLKELFAAMEF